MGKKHVSTHFIGRRLLTNGGIADNSEIKGNVSATTISYDYLVYGVGAEVQTFNIPGVKEHACFMKELADAERVRAFFFPCTWD